MQKGQLLTDNNNNIIFSSYKIVLRNIYVKR